MNIERDPVVETMFTRDGTVDAARANLEQAGRIYGLEVTDPYSVEAARLQDQSGQESAPAAVTPAVSSEANNWQVSHLARPAADVRRIFDSHDQEAA